MDYEKKYREALNKAKDMLSNKEVSREDMEYLFPELQDSEDKRIRKELIFYLGDMPEDTELRNGVTNRDVLVWLEKQGEQKLAEGTFVNVDDVREDFVNEVYRVLDADSTNDRANQIIDAFDNLPTVTIEKQGVQPRYNIGDVICDKSCTTLNKEAQPNMEIVDIQNGMYICDKGSFPVSQQGEYELVSKKIDTKLNDNSVSNELRAASFAHAKKEILNPTFPGNEEFELAYTFEEGAKWDAAQKHTWSEDDEYMTEKLLGWLNTLINYIQGDATVSLDLYRERKRQVEIIKTWLKSLKALNTWKPSDEQMEALEHFIRSIGESGYSSPYDDNIKLLYSLLEDLKKLK